MKFPCPYKVRQVLQVFLHTDTREGNLGIPKLFLAEEIQYHGGLRSRELGQAPILLCVPNSLAGVIISPVSADGLTVLATG